MNFAKNRKRSKRNSLNVMVNSEKWRNYGRRISKKNCELLNHDSDDDEPKYDEIKTWVQQFFEGKGTSDKTDQDVEVQLTRKQTLILSTLVPDEVLLMDKFDSSEPKRFVGVLLMADVSGYTSLSEKYNNTGKGGTYRLTVTLNTYLGSLVELIYSHGGDILKFAGDAFLALWKTDKRSFLSHTIHNVIACALIIQHSYSSYETDVKVNLRVKLAISAGNLMFAPIGRGIDMNYVIFGLPVIEAKTAESVCASGEVKLTPNAWGHCYSRNYDHYIHDDGHVTIKSILYDPHETNVNKPFLGFGAMIKQVKLLNEIPEAYWDSKNVSAADAAKRNEVLGLRKNILLAEEKNIGGEIRKFMIRPVLTQIDAHQPLEYLTEMRQVSILFLTLKPRECAFAQLITIVNNAYQISCEIVYKSMGCVNKIILFDKDVMMLVVFGLRGFKHESEAQAALKCAYSIKKSISSLDGVLELSIGVTTGQVYCGVVGHPLRKEFTVIGAVVNKAARLMCKFQNKVTCDEATFIKSKLSSNGFTLQPKTELKGIVYSGNIYEYTEDIRIKQLYNIPMTPPLLGQNDELEYFQSWLEDSTKTYRDFDALLLVADSGLGKTRLLEWMARDARNKNFHVCYLSLSSIHSSTPYLAVSQIFNQILDLEEPVTGFNKEEKIVQLIKVYDDDLCYLNNIIKVRFAYNENNNSQDEQKRKEKAKNIFSALIAAITETQVLFIDDLQNLDAFSWEFISLMFSSSKIFIVMTVTRGKFSSVGDWLYTVLINNAVRKIILEPLPPSLIPALACQILDVNAVPKDLCDVLVSKCNGIPSLIESFLSHLFCNGALELIKTNYDVVSQWEQEDLIFPPKKLIHPQALESKYQQNLDDLLQADLEDSFIICIVTRKDELNADIDVQNLDALVMIQIDSLTPYQQLLLKIASVIGNTLSRDLLENIMYENNWLTTAKAVKRLFAMRILACANSWSSRSCSRGTLNTEPTTTSFQSEKNLSCDCYFEYDPENQEKLPKYAFCKVMKFKNKNTRKTCYELLPINQKKEFHSRIVNYLENNPQKCPYCGGNIMVVQSVLSLVPTRKISDNDQLERVDSFSSDSYEETDNSYQEIKESNYNIRNNLRSYESQNFQVPYTRSYKNIKEFITSTSDSVVDRKKKRKSVFEVLKIPNVSILKNRNNNKEKRVSRQSMKRVTMTNISFKKSMDEINNHKVFDKLRDVIEAETLNDWHKLGVVDSLDNIDEDKDKNKQRLSLSIEKNVSQIDVTKCTCADLHVAIYDQLIHHAIQAELKTKAIQFMITYSYLNLLGSNFEVIFAKLEEAENMCSDFSELDNHTKKQYLGKIYSLRAATCLLTGKLTAARIELDRAFKIYKINLDKVTDIIKFNKIITYIKMRGHKYRAHAIKMKSDSVFCLNIAILLNTSVGEDKRAKMAAVRALQIIREVECPLIDICDIYSSAIQVEINRGMADATVDMEKMAYQSFKRLGRPAKADELYALGKFFMECFRARIARAKLPCAIRSGFRVLTISRYLQADKVALEVIPDLFYILLSRRRIEEAIDVLQLTLLFDHQSVHETDTWYYAMCMDLILDAGFQKENPLEITRYAEFSLIKTTAGPARRRLIAGLWTYWLRANSDKRAKMFETEALSLASSENDDGSLSTLLSSLRIAEGMLESLARKVEDLKKVVDLMELRSIADRELIRLESDARLMRTLYPRWIRLRGNTLKLSGRTVAATTLFNQALEESRRVNNRLEESLSRAALSNPIFWIQNVRKNNFIDWRPGIEHAHSSWHQIMYRMTTSQPHSQH